MVMSRVMMTDIRIGRSRAALGIGGAADMVVRALVGASRRFWARGGASVPYIRGAVGAADGINAVATFPPPLLGPGLANADVAIGNVLSIRSVHVPPMGTLWRFQPPQPLPREGRIAVVVHLPAGPTGGAASAPPIARRLGVRD